MTDIAANFLSAALGAIVGAVAAYLFQARESRLLAKGAARAVYIEMVGNMTAARTGAAGDPLGRLSRDVYVAESPRLAAYLRPKEMLAVAWAYELVDDGAEALATLRRGGGRKAQDPERALLEEIAAAIAPATTLLNPRMWSRSERAELTQAARRRSRSE